MFNKETKTNTTLTMTLVTSGKNDNWACAATIHAPSGLERTISVLGSTKEEAAISCLAKAANRITGNSLDIELETDSKYLRDMLGGGYRKAISTGAEIVCAESWKIMIAALKAHKAKITAIDTCEDDEITERAKATAKWLVKKAAVTAETEAA